MTIDKLLEIYQIAREGVSDNNQSYSLGISSLRLVWQEIFDKKIPISKFDNYHIVLYGIVSVLHLNEKQPQWNPQWKFEEARRISSFSSDELRAYVQKHLKTKPSQRNR